MSVSKQLVCNFSSCSKVLQDISWITSCSHVFCDEHGSTQFAAKRGNKCPLCQADLPNQLDIIKADVNPSEQYKAMILAGQKPEAIIEICSRALSLWHYQIELMFSLEKQEKVMIEKRAQDAVAKLVHEKSVVEMDLKMKRSRNFYDQDTEKELQELQRKNNEMDNLLAEKNRQNLKLSAAFDALKCRLADQDARQQQMQQPPERLSFIASAPSHIGFMNSNPPPLSQRYSDHFDSTRTQHTGAGHVTFPARQDNGSGPGFSFSAETRRNTHVPAFSASQRDNQRTNSISGIPAPVFNLNF